VYASSGWLSEALHPLWICVQLPDSVPPATQLVGRVTRADTGVEAGTFSRTVAPMPMASGRSYELSFAVEPGAWKVDLALLGDGLPLAVTTIEATSEAAPPAGTSFSPLYWGVEVRKDEGYRPGDPFTIGGWHVTPRAGNRYTKDETLSYFCFVLRPGLDQQQQPQAEVSFTVFRGPQKLSGSPPQPTRLSRIAGDLWMIGSALPLYFFNKPGELRLEVTIRDGRSNASRTTKIPLAIAGAAPPPTPISAAPAPT
jgi:hypothetical protein